ncbi:MAG: GNAT family N-acetyltransferase [Planctomycetota bacterium]|jgi:GNAT superfamily N-acetyltransferase
MSEREIATRESIGDDLGRAIAKQFQTICRMFMRGSGCTREPGFCRIITGEPHPLGNFAIMSDAAEPEQTRRAIEPLLELEVPSAVVLPAPASEEVDAIVGDSGYVVAESMPAMAVDVDRVARPELPAGHELVEVDSRVPDARWDAALAAGYELPLKVAQFFAPGRRLPEVEADPRSLRYFAVVREGEYVATSLLFLESGLAGIYCVATLPEHRGRGLGGFVTAEPLHLVAAEGYRLGILQSSAMGEPVYRRLGFESHGVLPLYARVPEGAG